MLEVLGSEPAKAVLKEPQKLKYLLAPAIAKTAMEQRQFYAVFDQYLAELMAPLEELPPLPPRTWRDFLNRWWWIPGVLIIAGVVAVAIWNWPSGPEPQIGVKGPDMANPGEMVTFMADLKNVDTTTARPFWSLQDLKDQNIEAVDSNRWSWSFPARVNGRWPQKVIQLQVRIPGRDSVYQAINVLSILCPDRPEVDPLTLPERLEVNEPFTFNATLKSKGEFAYEWDFGDSTTSTEPAPTHAYAREGNYYITLRVTRKGVEGLCFEERVQAIAVGEEKVLLSPLPLDYDEVTPQATWGLGMWALLGFLGIGVFFFMALWLRKWAQPPPPEPEQPKAEAFLMETPDRGPYFIPFRVQNQLIKSDPVQYRLADMLRLRQEGHRVEVDVPRTVRDTIDGGGFPRLRFRTNTQPTEYLFLIDRQSANSHQAKLFQHLARTLRDQDVHVELFQYDTDLFRLWNESNTEGINLDILQRLYPTHRLVVMGDAHGLLDPAATARPAIRPGLLAVLQGWKNRLLLTPLPPASWTFRETVLGEWFVIFPSDTEGLASAAKYVENGLEPSDLPPSFREWQEKQAKARHDADVNYRTWKTLADHEDYLAGQPDLMRWLRSLAVYPTPTWEITLAIGESLGLEVTHDKLLYLARIPSLQQGEFHPRLRKQLLDALDPADEALARAAVKRELDAVAAATRDSHANTELQTNLALTNFALDPLNREYQAAVAHLLDAAYFSRSQEEELNRAVKAFRPIEQESFMSKVQQKMESVYAEDKPLPDYKVQDFLTEQAAQPQAPEEKPKKSFFIPEFWRFAAVFGFFWIILVGMWTLEGTDWLYRTAFGEDPLSYRYDPGREMHKGFLVKERLLIDSAVVANNEAVEIYWNTTAAELDNIAQSIAGPVTFSGPPQVRAKLEEALKREPSYDLARQNLARLNYNLGVAYFNAQRNSSTAGKMMKGLDTLALRAFQEAAQYLPEQLNAWHGMGLSYYYLSPASEADLMVRYSGMEANIGQNNFNTAPTKPGRNNIGNIGNIRNIRTATTPPNLGRDSANYYYQQLLSKGYFDTLTLFPNLRTLLGQQPTELLDVLPNDMGPTTMRVSVLYYLNPRDRKDLRWELEALGSLAKPLSVNIPLARADARPRRNTAQMTLRANLRANQQVESFTLRLRLRDVQTGETVIDTLIFRRKVWGTKPAPSPRGIPDPMPFSLSGEVLDAATNQALQGVTITLQSGSVAQQNQVPILEQTQTDAYGFYTLKLAAAPTGITRVLASRNGYQSYQTTLIPQAESRAQTLNIRLEPEKQPAQKEQRPPDDPKPQTTATVPRPKMVPVRDGTFQMGDVMGDKEDKDEDVHRVTLSSYEIGANEVTFEEYDAFCTATSREQPGDYGWGRGKKPVINVSWDDAIAYCNWLSEQHRFQPVYNISESAGGKGPGALSVTVDWNANGYRLPTEAEWEYAAREGGKNIRFGNGKDIATTKEINFDGSANNNRSYAIPGEFARQTFAVGSFPANALGLYDMSGNVFEWCWDWYGNYQARVQNDPKGPNSGSSRVVRGGSWYNQVANIRAASRDFMRPDSRVNSIGFRLVRRQ